MMYILIRTFLMGLMIASQHEAFARDGGFIVKFKSVEGARATLINTFKTITISPMGNSGGQLESRELSESRGIFWVRDPQTIAADPEVEYFEPNFRVHAYFGRHRSNHTRGPAPDPVTVIAPAPVSAAPVSSPDPAFMLDPQAWGVVTVQADQVMRTGVSGKDVVIAVIDTGVDPNHPALKGKVLEDEGYDFVNHHQGAMDDNSHGTHVAGTIVGTGIGVAQGASILPLKFLNATGSGNLADAILAIDYARKLKVEIMSNSWGSGDYSQALNDIITTSIREGILFIAAAGNEASDNDSVFAYPADYPGVLAVAATDRTDRLASFSNYGSAVALAAPGVSIYSSVLKNKYASYSGTSMATPSVAGVAALVLSQSPNLSPAAMISCLGQSVDAISADLKTSGRINAMKAVNYCR